MKILFVHNSPTKFVQIDHVLLRERYEVHEWYQHSRVVNLAKLMQAVTDCDLVFGWFASWHTFFPVLFAQALGRPSTLVVGGYDVAKMSGIRYGNQCGGFKQWVSRRSIHNANALVTFSEFSRREALQNANAKPSRTHLVYLGVQACDQPLLRKEDLILTVGNVDSGTLYRKGLLSFVQAASFMPQISFLLIGRWRDNTINYLKQIASPNVQFLNWVDDIKLNDYLSRARVYVQASLHEGFGLSVAEAMLHKCVPVVTRAGSLPEVVGECGVYIDSTDPRAVALGIRHALTCDDRAGQNAHERIIAEFPLERRRAQLFKLIDELLKSHG
ncbi:Alpha-maltose-1-phosphate synthase [Anaerolineae bacterium]|nr:Alpha-maltose-1-phosphate synthase [Anaerolineae bacterium]